MSDPANPAPAPAAAPAAPPAAPVPAPVAPVPAPAQASLPLQPAAPPAPLPPSQPATPVDPAAVRFQTEMARVQAEADQRVRAEQVRAEQAITGAKAAEQQLHAALVDAHLTTLAARTIAPAQVVSLIRSQFAVKDGKVVHTTDASKTPAQVVEAWLATEGRHFLPASVPAGAGSPGIPAAPSAPEPLDLTTSKGATAFVHGLLAIPGAAPAPASQQTPAAPASPAAPARTS